MSEFKVTCPKCNGDALAVFPEKQSPENPLGRSYICCEGLHGRLYRQDPGIGLLVDKLLDKAHEEHYDEIQTAKKAYAESIAPRLEIQIDKDDQIVNTVRDIIKSLPVKGKPLARMNTRAVKMVKDSLSPFMVDALVENGVILVEKKIEPMKTQEQLFKDAEVTP